MRQIRLVSYFLIGLFVGGLSISAFAGELKYVNSLDASIGSAIKFVTGLEACNAVKATIDPTWSPSACSPTTNTCTDAIISAGGNCDQYWNIPHKYGTRQTSSRSYYCPDSASHWDGSACGVPNPCASKSGMYYNNGQYSTSNLAGGDGAFSGPTQTPSRTPATFCQDGCQMATLNLDGGASGNTWYGKGNPTYTGASCSASDGQGTTKPPTTPEYDCVKAGKGFGYFNGNVICTDINNTSSKTSNTKTTTNPDGTKQDVKTDSSVKCDGTVCITTTTTTTTTYDSSGTTTGTTTKTDSTSKPDPSASGSGTKGDSAFCAQNPDSPMCKTGSFGGSCTSEPSCDGDPVQCATAKATWQANCKAMKAGDPPATTDPVGETKVKLDFTPVSMSGGGSCPADRVVTVQGKSINIPFTALCDFAGTIKPVMIALGWLLAAYIVFGYKSKEA